MTPCLADETIAAWAADALSADERERAIEHAASCELCRALVGHLVAAPAAIAMQIGRFEVRGPLGAGGMGVVMRGYDPVLGREVALKMIKSTLVEPAHRDRMLREAQAMAKVRHGCVVTVHELGEAADELYVAMELVEGTMLQRWLETPRPLAARLAVVLGIGRGIAAVHAAGLLHRDIKPDNIVVRDDGTPVLVDFGLARATGIPVFGAGSGVAGTPRYLAPEVAAGQPATMASDQYQWWTIVEETLAGLRGRRARAVARTCARGHDRDPARRFATMNDALAALERAVATRGTWLLAAGALLAIGGVALFAITRSGAHDDGCSPRLPRGWSPVQRTAIDVAVRRAGLDPAPVLAALDARVSATMDLRQRACLAGPLGRAEWTRRLVCTDETWAKTGPLLARLAADPAQVRDAADDLGEVPPLARCASGSLPAVPEQLSPFDHERYAALVGVIQHLEVAAAMRPAERAAKLRALEPMIAALRYAPLDARWHWAIGHALHDGNDNDGAVREYDIAAQAGLAAGDDNLYVRALILELQLTSSADKFALLEAQAEGGARRLANPSIDAELAYSRAMHYLEVTEHPKARALFEQADALYTKAAVAPMRLQIATLHNLGATCLEMGDLDAAERVLRRGVSLARARYTEQAAEYWEARGALATALLYRSDLGRADTELRATVAGLERTTPDSMQAGQLRAYLCLVAMAKLDLARARGECAASVASIRARAGADTPYLVWPLTLSGQVEMRDGKLAEALAFLEHAVAIAIRDPRSMETLTAQAYYAVALAKAHRTAEARALATKIAPGLRAPPLAEAHGEFARAFPDLE